MGNAVPPPLAAAIGREIKKCVVAKAREDWKDSRSQEQPAKTVKEEVIKMEEVQMD